MSRFHPDSSVFVPPAQGSRRFRLNRRDALKAGAAAAGLAGAATLYAPRVRAEGDAGRLLFIVAASGGANIVDSFMAVSQQEGNGGAAFAPGELVQPAGSNLRGVAMFENSVQGAIGLGNGYAQETFLQRHAADTLVMTQECTSVNHLVAAKRAVTGNDVNAGRTLGEAAALRHGEGLLLPNANMTGGGYLEDGGDRNIPIWARAEPINDARLFAFSTHGYRGVPGAPSAGLLKRARGVRDALEAESGFNQTFRGAPMLAQYLARRGAVEEAAEASSLITKLMVMQNVPGSFPLSDYDLESSPVLAKITAKLPDVATDPLEAQAALAFLLTRYGVSCAVTLGPGTAPIFENTDNMINAPIAFDWSHNDHRGGQNAMWSRVLKVADALITLLKEEDHLGDASKGKMWDRSVMYVATEFGRDKISSGGSGHHLNNGNLMMSPLMYGNRVYGGVDPNTCLTHGFDPQSGEPTPGQMMREQHVYSAVAHALDIEFGGRIDMPAMVRGA